jgi:hypothetical protein
VRFIVFLLSVQGRIPFTRLVVVLQVVGGLLGMLLRRLRGALETCLDLLHRLLPRLARIAALVAITTASHTPLRNPPTPVSSLSPSLLSILATITAQSGLVHHRI